MAGRTRNVRMVSIVLQYAIEIVDDGFSNGKCSFTGIVGDVITDIIKPTRRYINCTIDVVEDTGKVDPITGLYDGAIGLVQQDKADMLSLPVYFPLYDPGDQYFDYGPPLTEDTMTIACLYNTITNGSATDVLDMFTSVPVQLWWFTVVGFVTFVLLLQVGYRILGIAASYRSPLWMVICAFLMEDNFPDDNVFNMIVTTTATLFLFFYGNYLMNSMSSDLVVFDKPEVIESYQDIIDRHESGRKMNVISPSQLPESQVFAQAEEGSMLKKLWNLVKPISFSSGAVAMIDSIAKPLINQEMVAILRDVAMKSAAAGGFNMNNQIHYVDDINVLFSTDESNLKYTNVLAFSKSLDPIAKGQIQKMSNRIQEAGILEYAYREIPFKMGERSNGYMTMLQKASTKVVMGESDLPIIGLINTARLFYLTLALFTFSFAVLCLELVVKEKKVQFVNRIVSLVTWIKNKRKALRRKREIRKMKKEKKMIFRVRSA